MPRTIFGKRFRKRYEALELGKFGAPEKSTVYNEPSPGPDGGGGTPAPVVLKEGQNVRHSMSLAQLMVSELFTYLSGLEMLFLIDMSIQESYLKTISDNLLQFLAGLAVKLGVWHPFVYAGI